MQSGRFTLRHNCSLLITPTQRSVLVGENSTGTKLGWWRGVAVTRFIRSMKLLYARGRVSTWMGDCLPADKPFWYVTSRLGQLSLLSLRGR